MTDTEDDNHRGSEPSLACGMMEPPLPPQANAANRRSGPGWSVVWARLLVALPMGRPVRTLRVLDHEGHLDLAWFTGSSNGARVVQGYVIFSSAPVMAMNSGGPLNLAVNLTLAIAAGVRETLAQRRGDHVATGSSTKHRNEST